MDRSPSEQVTAVDDPLAGIARDASTITDVLRTLETEGFDGQFIVRDDGELECAHCRTRTSASAIPVEQVRRLEGASDPDDMLAVAALTCPSCGTRGTVVLGYGPAAAAEDADVMATLDAAPAPAPGRVEQPHDGSP